MSFFFGHWLAFMYIMCITSPAHLFTMYFLCLQEWHPDTFAESVFSAFYSAI